MMNSQNYFACNLYVELKFDCNTMHCTWSKYIQGQHWDYYSETDGDCNNCKQRCRNDANCGAIECGYNSCSWWKKGTCEVGDHSNSAYFTCRPSSNGIFR